MSESPPPLPSDEPKPQPLGAESPCCDSSMPYIPWARPITADAIYVPSPDIPLKTGHPLSRWRAVCELFVLLAIAIAALLVGSRIARSLTFSDARWREMFITVWAGSCCIAAALWMAQRRGGTLASIGWRVNRVGVDIGIGLASAVVLLACLMATSIVLSLLYPEILEQSEKTREAIEQTIPPMQLPGMVLILTFVAIWEEVIFRGFLLTRLQAVFRRWWLTIPVGATLFMLGHVYEGGMAMVLVWLLGIVMGGLFVWRRSLLPPIVLHFVFNFTMLLLMQLASDTWH